MHKHEWKHVLIVTAPRKYPLQIEQVKCSFTEPAPNSTNSSHIDFRPEK